MPVRTMRLVPKETLPSRMQPLSLLPVFLDLRGKLVIVAGAPEAAAWKTELCAAAGANVHVYCLDLTDDLAALGANPPAGLITLFPRAWMPNDLDGAALAIGALEGDEAEDFAIAAQSRGVPVNIVDNIALCTVGFGAIVNRSPVVIAISTDGAAPVLGQAIRARIETMLHPAIGLWAAAAKAIRGSIKARIPMGAARRAVWSRFAELAMAARQPPPENVIDDLSRSTPSAAGSIVIVGAGPGDPELLTMKALRALQSADVILYDRLVAPEILELARREARRMLVGKQGGGPACRQDDINQLMVALAKSGKRVIRLKGGDPTVFGRLAEELAAARADNIAVEVIPGITAATGAAASLQVSLTDRRYAKRLQFVTGHAADGQAPEHRWAQLADAEATTVFYMGGRTFAAMADHMIAAGCPQDWPAVVVWSATTSRQKTKLTTVSGVAGIVPAGERNDPCLIIVGEIARHVVTPPTVSVVAGASNAAQHTS